MKLSIHPRESRDREELRTLLIDAADQLLGNNSKLLEPRLPWDGHPILAADADHHPVLISFDPEQSHAALLNGLQAIEQLRAALPWVNQVYESLQTLQRPPRLVIVSQEYPPGAETILADCKSLDIYKYKMLNINGETGLWLDRLQRPSEPITESKPEAVATNAPIAMKSDTTGTDELPALSEEEAAYFQQL